ARLGLGAGWGPLPRAGAQAAPGGRAGAARSAELGARRGLDGRQHHCALWCAFDCWRFVQSAASARLVIEASAAADGHWSRAFAATAQGWLDQDLDLLTTAHEAFTGIGAPRFAELVERHRRRLSAGEPRDLLAESLTRREAEVAALAARGLTNRAIAELFGLSVRTAETHLHRAMGKLGANRREDLLLHADRLDPGV
ncbi:MAG TPA: LuxR C-terminal-related transcriptional regulator, partial [Microthrixaceae bacterium]|nr:LuxR C-terminal-related transcriptional regulator [Microthrixaceae bacterium]